MVTDKNSHSHISWFTNDSYPYGLSYGRMDSKMVELVFIYSKVKKSSSRQSGEFAAKINLLLTYGFWVENWVMKIEIFLLDFVVYP